MKEGRETNPFYDKKQDKMCALNWNMSVFPKAILQTHAHKRTHPQMLVASQDSVLFFRTKGTLFNVYRVFSSLQSPRVFPNRVK
jgi:hypothetical protein